MVRAGGDSWFFITADYAFGHALERDTGNFVRAAGGRVLGAVRTPFPGTTDFSSFLVQAQASRAKVIGLANAGADTINCIKQAAEFGLTRRGMKLAALLMFIIDVHSRSACRRRRGWSDRDLLLGPERPHPRLHPARAPRPTAATSRPWCRPAAMPSALHYLKAVDMARPRPTTAPRSWPHEGDADRRRRLRPGHDPRGRPQDPPGLPVRGEDAGRNRGAVGLLQAAADHPGARRPSARSAEGGCPLVARSKRGPSVIHVAGAGYA